ncbi:hypothetical protein ACOY8K_005276, partial [Escherichia coli]
LRAAACGDVSEYSLRRLLFRAIFLTHPLIVNMRNNNNNVRFVKQERYYSRMVYMQQVGFAFRVKSDLNQQGG